MSNIFAKLKKNLKNECIFSHISTLKTSKKDIPVGQWRSQEIFRGGLPNFVQHGPPYGLIPKLLESHHIAVYVMLLVWTKVMFESVLQ